MSEIHLTWGLPCCSSKQVQETNLSLRLRITAIVIGIILISAGSLSLAGTPFFNQLGMIESWSLIASGIVLSLIPAVVKQVKVSEIDSNHSSSSSKRSSHKTDERSDASDADADPIEGQPKGLCHFERLPLELKKELLKFLDAESLVAFSMTNKQNLQLIKDCNYEKKIQAGRWRKAALNAWKKSLFNDKDDRFFLKSEMTTRALLKHYPKQMMKEFSSALAEIKRMDKDKQEAALARIAYILPELAWKCPEAAKIVNQLPTLGLNGLIWGTTSQDAFDIEYHNHGIYINEYYIRAFSATDPDHAIELFQKLLNDRTKVKILPWRVLSWIIAGCVRTKTPKTRQFLEEFHARPTSLNICDDILALSFLITRASEEEQPEVVQELVTSVAAPLIYTSADFITATAVLKAYITFNDYDRAFEWIDKIPDLAGKYKERLLIFFAQQCTLEKSSNALVFLQELQTRAQKLNEQGHLALVEIAIQLHQLDSSKAKLCIQTVLDTLKDQESEKLLSKIVEYYALFDLSQAKKIADGITRVDIKIEALVLIAQKTRDETQAEKIFKDAIIYLQNADKQEHEQKKAVYYIAKHYASISINRAETLLLNFYKRWGYAFEGIDHMYRFLSPYINLEKYILETLAAMDFKKTVLLLQNRYNANPTMRALHYLEIAETLIESHDNPFDPIEFSW